MMQTNFLLTLICVMLAAGFVGGMLNYFMTRSSDPEDSNLIKSLTLGVGAAFLVPLFLNMISSNLLDTVRTNAEKKTESILVFGGFCLVAAISSTAFIKTLSSRILQEAREAKKVAHEAKSDADLLLQREIEREPPSQTASGVAPLPSNVSDKEMLVLENLARGKLLRTRTSIASQTKIPKQEVDQIMENFKRSEWVNSKKIRIPTGEERRRWYITEKGRESVAARP